MVRFEGLSTLYRMVYATAISGEGLWSYGRNCILAILGPDGVFLPFYV